MRNLNEACMFQEDMTTIKVIFDAEGFENFVIDKDQYEQFGQKEYSYKARKSDKIQAGDYVVVPASGNLKVVRVTKVDEVADIDYNANFKYQWIIGKVHFSDYINSIDSESKFYAVLREGEKKRMRKQIIDQLKEQYGDDLIESAAAQLRLD
jgi:hypothetical protein